MLVLLVTETGAHGLTHPRAELVPVFGVSVPDSLWFEMFDCGSGLLFLPWVMPSIHAGRAGVGFEGQDHSLAAHQGTEGCTGCHSWLHPSGV